MAQTFNTYSFEQVRAVINPTGFGSANTNGAGIGEIGISYDDNNTEHDRAADGVVMVSKIVANNGRITLTCQQTSALNNYLHRLFNYLYNASPDVWASTVITVSSPNGLNDFVLAEGCSFEKRADLPFAQQGQNVTWTWRVANMQFPIGGQFDRLLGL